MIEKAKFPEYTNSAINDTILLDKLNEVIDKLNEKPAEKKLKEGVKIVGRGSYMLNGKMIKKAEAYES